MQAETNVKPHEQNRVYSPDCHDSSWEIEVLYDGECPLCLREITMLRKLDQQNRIRFTDIAAEDFDALAVGIAPERLMAEIHGRLPDGTWITGVEVFRRLYAAVGFRRIVALSRFPGISQALSLGYHLFAKNRLKLTGRCSADSDVCSIAKK